MKKKLLQREAPPATVSDLDARIAKLETRLKKDVDIPVERLRRLLARMERDPARLRPRDATFLSLADELIGTGRTLLDHDRLYTLWQASANVAHLGLPAVEVGVYRGGSTSFIASALAEGGAGDVPVHAFDTFTGHPGDAISEFDPHHAPGHFGDTSIDDVREFLARHPNVEVHQAPFPDGARLLPPGPIALAHLDTDLYGPTLASLRLFTERMPTGAVIVVDDYGAGKTGGVLKAVREFMDQAAPFQEWDFGTEQVVLVRR